MEPESASQPDRPFQLKLTGDGLALDQPVDRATAVAIVNVVLGGALPPQMSGQGRVSPQGQAPPSAPAGGAAHGLSVGEFLESVRAKRNPDKIVAMGVYLKEQGQTEFMADDIKPLFQSAGEPTPGNFARDWRWAQTSKWIAPAGANPKGFYVTKTGEDAVRTHFPSDVRKSTSQPVRKKTRKKRGAGSDA